MRSITLALSSKGSRALSFLLRPEATKCLASADSAPVFAFFSKSAEDTFGVSYYPALTTFVSPSTLYAWDVVYMPQ